MHEKCTIFAMEAKKSVYRRISKYSEKRMYITNYVIFVNHHSDMFMLSNSSFFYIFLYISCLMFYYTHLLRLFTFVNDSNLRIIIITRKNKSVIIDILYNV